ncbi:MAG: hypothetical protein WD009_13680 [Phycisphaeraceae bacterium]
MQTRERHTPATPAAMPGTRDVVGAPRLRAHRDGFTLIEAALTTVIIGTAVLAIVAAQQAYHQQNGWAQRSATAQLLANEIRELTLTMPVYDPFEERGPITNRTAPTDPASFRSVIDFAGDVAGDGFGTGTEFAPPINALRLPIPDLTQWRQIVDVENVQHDNIAAENGLPLGTTAMVRVIVRVEYRMNDTQDWEVMTRLTWVVGA